MRGLGHAYIYIYIYTHTYAVELLSGPSLAFLILIIWSKYGLLSGPRWFLTYIYSGFRRLFFVQLSFCVLFLCPLPANFLKLPFFQKMGAFFSRFLCFRFNFWKISFSGLLKHYKIRVSTHFCVFVAEREENKNKRMITGISGLGFFGSKNGRFVTHICFSKCFVETPIFIVFFGARFLGQGVKKGKVWTPTKNLADNWKVHFCFFGLFFFFLSLLLIGKTCFPPQKGLFVYFWVSPLVSP